MRLIGASALAGLALAGALGIDARAAAPPAVVGKYTGTDEGGPGLVTISGAAPQGEANLPAANYNLGLSKINNDDGSGDGGTIKNKYFSIKIGYFFGGHAHK